ncbi:PH domain-containing protein [Capnocytophaga sp.]|uniref:PH domain-containing protein n=1 Tax=Capnocytophaga sp. TaxID=44737 RepID=UPI0026DBD96C|nr:PH domain-containing protein [Capnocytophaga sp.]MDO5106507.1 PH domain-containing protein [Capnocytophaga sp.]
MFKNFLSGVFGSASQVSQEELNREYGQLLVEGERIELGFVLIRDMFIFTNKRLILVDKQGFTGKKVEYMSVAYKSISRFSIETAGSFDLDAELKIWVSGEHQPSIQKQFNKSVNVYEVQRILASYIL